MSSFDDLLKELDAPPVEPTPEEDPLRHACLKRLIEESKQLEKIALILDASEKKHPLYGQTVPSPARMRLKELVNRLMDVQKALQDIEESLLAPPLDQPPQQINDSPDDNSVDPEAQAAFDREKSAFALYKDQWEAVFAADPAQRVAHPEVQTYYEQMETYFANKQHHLTGQTKKGTE